MIALDTPQPRPLQTARRLAKHGIPVFPCRADTKAPYTARGFHEATTDAATISAWWKRWPMALVGMPTGKASGRVVLDCDNKSGEHEGQRSLERLEAEHGELPDTPQAITRTQGSHYYFAAPDAADVPCSAGKLGEGVDVRGDGGYVIVPGSTGYEWDAAHHPADVPLAPIPDWLLRKMLETGGTGRPRVRQGATDTAEKIPAGRRNSTMTSHAGRLREMGYVEEEIAGMLEVLNQSRCDPPMDSEELHSIARSVCRYERGTFAIGPDEGDAVQQAEYNRKLQSATVRAEHNPALRQEAKVLVATANYVAAEVAAGRHEDGYVHVPYGHIAEKTGVSARSVSRYIADAAAAQLCERDARRTMVKVVDPDTGEVGHRSVTRVHVRIEGALLDQLERLADYKPERGKRLPRHYARCPEHPNAGTVKRWTLHCAECDKLLDQDEEYIKPSDSTGQIVQLAEEAPALTGHGVTPRYVKSSVTTCPVSPEPDMEAWDSLYQRAEASTPRVARPESVREQLEHIHAELTNAEARGDTEAVERLLPRWYSLLAQYQVEQDTGAVAATIGNH